MKININSFGNFNELVFENKNKAYGAYALRKSYNDNVTRSLIITCSFFGLLVFTGVVLTNANQKVVPVPLPTILPDTTISRLINITPLPKPEIEIEEKVLPKEKVKPKATPLNLTVTDKIKIDSVSTSIKTANVENGTPKGDSASQIGNPPIGTIKVVAPTASNVPLALVGEMPEFNGNLSKYLSDNIQYPRMAVEAGTSGTVYVTFVVEQDGSIGNVKILRGVGDGCTEEAMRVVKGMPNWKPGKNHGMPVRVQYNLPVKFRLK